ncbi:Allophanate hydrolase subunit 1 [Segniliparus rotundus DSM 44985]|uniref:Allophanate hydrolase subunit 1 n=1 Tax=Segniliparus rotundus (strain ATCC BAA-972 / CDC 1076 / CIP 108378 / DSM 44985 / JCM 13578) TaxID=640132 RepID=D6ZAD1_SEGRD|nr:allophanate hydrolase subunit 1 [Segniliparus rotundus]ADG96673.1 Allophanate hydrolase subunit 1 [Segniliparus rotundus DSM 44985]
MRVMQAGTNALLIECEGQEQVFALYKRLRADRRFVEAVPGDRTLLVVADSDIRDTGLVEEVHATEIHVTAEPPGPVVVVKVRYDGPDLAEVAELTGMSVREVVDAHTGSAWTTQFLGFSPGFAYLANPEAGLAVPRRESPRARVPAGAVALGAAYCAVYPMATPGGWRLIGATDAPMWDPRRDPPALLAPGSTVVFEAVT